MTAPLRTPLLAAIALFLAACSSNSRPDSAAAPPLAAPASPAPLTMPTPAPRTAASDLRTNGDLAQRHERIVAEAKKGGWEIAFIGDSITEGWAGAGKDAWEKTWAPRHAINCGIGGDRTQHVIGRLDHDLLDALAAPNNNIKWVVLLIGTNNTGTPTPPNGDSSDDIALGNLAILTRLHDRLPNAQIALMAVFPRGQWPNPQRDTINALNIRLAQFAASDPARTHLVNINDKFLTPQAEIPHDLMPDYLHLSPGGYQVWSDRLESTINPAP